MLHGDSSSGGSGVVEAELTFVLDGLLGGASVSLPSYRNQNEGETVISQCQFTIVQLAIFPCVSSKINLSSACG